MRAGTRERVPVSETQSGGLAEISRRDRVPGSALAVFSWTSSGPNASSFKSATTCRALTPLNCSPLTLLRVRILAILLADRANTRRKRTPGILRNMRTGQMTSQDLDKRKMDLLEP